MIDEKMILKQIEQLKQSQFADESFVAAVAALEILINTAPKVGDWILCSEVMPNDESIMYWTTHEDGSLVMHGYKKENGFIYNWEVDDLEKRERQGGVVAWMPNYPPEPYKDFNKVISKEIGCNPEDIERVIKCRMHNL